MSLSWHLALAGGSMFAPAFARQQRLKERRAHHRFTIILDVDYKLVDSDKKCGRGCTVNLCSKGVLFEAPERLPVGSRVQLSMAWPMKLNGTIALTLRARGTIVRRRKCFIAVSISSHEFCTRRVEDPTWAVFSGDRHDLEIVPKLGRPKRNSTNFFGAISPVTVASMLCAKQTR